MRSVLRDNFLRPAVVGLAVALGCLGWVSGARAQYRMDVLPEGAGQDISQPQIVEKPNAQLPLDADFVRSDGVAVKLGSVFGHNKPVVLSLVYFSCPLLCGVNQDSLANAVKDGPRNLSVGKDYDIVVVSIDSDDTSADAAVKRAHYVDLMNRKPTEPGVTYLTGKEANVKELADAVGFGYRRLYNQDNKYLHATGIFICTPDGRLSQTILGVDYPSDTLHYRLVEASNGRIGSGMLSLALCCGAMKFNAATGMYENNPYFWVGTGGGLLTIVLLGGFMFYLFRTDAKRTKLPPSLPTATT
jgi:protein SCO1